jgi:hypothetical protein
MTDPAYVKGAPRPLSVRRLLLAEAVAVGMTRKKAAEFSGLSVKGVEVALKDPRMKAEIEKKIAEITKETRGKLRSVRNVAIAALGKVAGDESAPPAARVSAATAILDRIGVGKTEIVEIVTDDAEGSAEDRIARLASRLGSALSRIPDADETAEDEEPADESDDEEG